MKYFPVFLDSNYINAMVVGGGDVAARKIELLLKTTSNICVMSEFVSETVERLISTHQLKWLAHNYQQGLLDDINLLIAATDDPIVNKAVSVEGNQRNLLVNVVDQPELCSYITPAIIDRTPMIVAMSSSASAPILLRMLREQVEKYMPSGYGKLADFSLKFRDHVKARVKGIKNRRAFWEDVLRGNIGELILSGEDQQAERQLIANLKEEVKSTQGDIVFIHTLLGDPDNLTLKAHRQLQFADAVIYDESVNEQFIEYVRRDADKYPQNIPSSVSINFQHAIDLALQGKKVIYILPGYIELPDNTALNNSGVMTTELFCGQ